MSTIAEIIEQTRPTVEAWDFGPEDQEKVEDWARVGLVNLSGIIVTGKHIPPAAVGLMAILIDALAATLDKDDIINATEHVIREAAAEIEREDRNQ